jgi:hypothetical protein
MHAMQSLLTAYADNEGDDDLGADDSTEQHPGANFISDDEEEHHSARKSDKDPKDERPTNSLPSDVVQIWEKEPMTDSPSAKRPKLQHTETGFVHVLYAMNLFFSFFVLPC